MHDFKSSTQNLVTEFLANNCHDWTQSTTYQKKKKKSIELNLTTSNKVKAI
jgi:hypothetical protein